MLFMYAIYIFMTMTMMSNYTECITSYCDFSVLLVINI